MKRCIRPVKQGTAAFASLKRSRYPYIYPRDTCAICRAMKRVILHTHLRENLFRHMEGIAKFMLAIQRDDGYWGQRYDQDGTDKSIYVQEDNVAMGILILVDYIITAHYLGRPIRNRDAYIKAIVKGMDYALCKFYNPHNGLFRTTTAIHESPIDTGYTIWANYAYLHAMQLLVELKTIGGIKMPARRYASQAKQLEKRLKEKFIDRGRFIRRIRDDGSTDHSADIALISPFIFNCAYPDGTMLETIRYLRKNLWDPEFHLLCRYPERTDSNFETHHHGGYGPWLLYSAMLARLHYYYGNLAEGDIILKRIFSYATKKGYLAEHITTKARFLKFRKHQYETGLDFRKEFDPHILIPDVTPGLIEEEKRNMNRSYSRIMKRVMNDKRKTHAIKYVIPLTWTHAEVINAILEKMNYLTR
ncbi:MAG: hypothetical protein ABH879_02665 [archaeon]